MGYKDIVNNFVNFNEILDMFIDTRVTDPITEISGCLVQEHDKYMEEILKTIGLEVSYELSEILRPYLKLNRTGIIESYIEMNDKFREATGWYNSWFFQEMISGHFTLTDVFDELEWIDNMVDA